MAEELAAVLSGLQLAKQSEDNDVSIDDILDQVAPRKRVKTSPNGSRTALKTSLETEFLTPSTTFSTLWLNKFQQRWESPGNYEDVFEMAPPQTRTIVRFNREGLEGRVTGYREVTVPANSATAKNSLSLLRKPANRVDFVRGAAGFFPFAPGGIDGLQSVANLEANSVPGESKGGSKLDRVIDFGGQDGGLLQVPPGFSRGLDFAKAKQRKDDQDAKQVEETLEEDPEDVHTEDGDGGVKLDEATNGVASEDDTSEDDIDSLLPVEFAALMPRRLLNAGASKRGREWAHMVDINRDITNFRELVPDMAREWPFELDTFQKEAVYHLENGDSVFVAAHTSAGKTVVAEYAIALAAKHMTKAIYTSPIKALSNQKFRDFKETFDDVGILTGDVQINPEASCLIMTTEILRSMLYRGADLIRDVEYVIFDEVHYVNDMERGVVWEEVIIMLPEHVTLILLSATVPNTYEFASWVGRTKKKDIYVISTPKRPVPLEHYLWANKATHKIVNSEKKFLEPGWKAANDSLSGRDKIIAQEEKAKAQAAAASRGGPQRGGQQRGGPQRGGRGRGQAPQQGRGNIARTGRGTGRTTAAQDRTIWVHLVHHLRKEELLPACIFVFSKKRCDENADSLANVDFCTAAEKSAIHMTVDRSVARLRPEDRNLPQIRRMRELLSRGIAVHHGGLLPIVKEIVELLFARTLVKVLFATETFAMGLNLPTRTVVFSGFRKHDGRSFRDLLPGEYTQMSGRAGRRGLDSVGTVIIVTQNADEAPPASVLKQMILGDPTKLRSQFRLTYNMILNLLRVEALKIEEMIKRSFSENATQALLPEHEKQVKVSESDLAKIQREPCEVCDVDIEQCHQAAMELKSLTADLHLQALGSPVGRRQFSTKRVIVFEDQGIRKAGVIINDGITSGPTPTVEILSIGTTAHSRQNSDILPYATSMRRFFTALPTSRRAMEWKVARIPVSSIECITETVVKCKGQIWYVKLNKEVEELEDFLSSLCSLWEDKRWDELDWRNKVKEVSLRDILDQRRHQIDIIDGCKCAKCPNFVKHFGMCHDEWLIKENISSLRQMMSDQNLALLPDYEQRIRVLTDLNFIDENSRVELKGKVACEIHSADELVLTELILENVLADFEPEEIVALLSAFVFQEKTDNEPTLTPQLEKGRDEIIRISEKVNHFQIVHQVILSSNDSNDFVSKPRFGMAEVVYEWARGMSFNRICDLTDIPEGTIVRVITRLDETCRECKNAARIIGDPKLFQKMQSAQELIKRDITAVASLYM